MTGIDTKSGSQDQGPPLDPRTTLITALTAGAGAAAAYSSTWATGIGTGVAVLMALHVLIGRRRP